MNKGLPIEWVMDCKTEESRKERENLIRNSVRFSEIFLSVLARKHESIERKGLKEEDYAEAGWMTLQAFRNGKIAILEELADLFIYLKKDSK